MTTLVETPVREPAPTPDALATRPFPLLRHSLVLAGRAVLKIRRTPEQLLDVTLQPIIFVLLFVYVFGGAVSGSTHDYLQYVLPAIMVQTVLFSSLSIGVNLNTDIKKGVFDRFRSLPIARSAVLFGAGWGGGVGFWYRLFMSCYLPLFLSSVGGRPTWAADDNADQRQHGSPIWQFKKCAEEGRATVPVLIMHGKNDERVPYMQAVAFRRACAEYSVPYEMVTYLREPHFVQERANRVDMLKRVLKFVELHLHGG